MGNFRPNNRNREFSSNHSGRDSGRSSRGFSSGRGGGFRDRDSGSFERGKQEMYKVTCDKCKKQCEVPFKPTGNKPVLCSDCFKKEGGSSSRNNSSSSGISQEQYKEINTKLDKILRILEMIEFEEEDSEDDSEEE